MKKHRSALVWGRGRPNLRGRPVDRPMTRAPATAPEARDANPWTDPRVRITLLNAGIFFAAAIVAAGHPRLLTVETSHLPIALGLIAGFALSEKLIFHIEARSEAVSYTPTE